MLYTLEIMESNMAKGLRVPLSFLNSFKMCRPKDLCSSVTTPLPVATYLLSPLNSTSLEFSFPSFPKPPPSTPNDPSPRGVPLSKVHPFGCGSGSTPELKNESPSYKYLETRKVEGEKMCYKSMISSDSNERARGIAPSRTGQNTKWKSKAKAKKSKASTNTTSSSGDNDETESLFSSPPSFNSSHDHFTWSLQAFTEEPHDKQKKSKSKHRSVATRRFKRFGSKDWIDGVVITPERLVPCKVDGKVNKSFVVVKRSVDPYEDFKKSILEMIMDKQMFEPRELEQLLMSFLSLNSKMHHQVIIEAFTEILKEVFSGH